MWSARAPGGDAQRASGQPHPKREVDVLVVEEEVASEAAQPLELLAADREAGARDEARLGIGSAAADRLAGATRPGDPREVHDPATGVDELSALGRDERLPAAHPEPSVSGAAIASRQPAAATASGLRKTRRSPDARAAPRLQAAGKPSFESLATTGAPGAAASTTLGVSSPEALSTTINSSPSRSSADERVQRGTHPSPWR